jgi:energy-coupling factor transporter ATP-binding protein EcfA2
MTRALADALHGLHASLDPTGIPPALAGRAADLRHRLEHDLLVRLGREASMLVVGIIGPNNAGKSTLFSLLSGTDASPSSPHGGYTRALVGAGHPDLVSKLEGTGVLRHLTVQRHAVSPDQAGLPSDPSRLHLLTSESVPAHLLLIDAPDFDSVFTENRDAAVALANTADVVLVVLTRHTYNNKAVRDFLQRAIAHGRPYLVLYNEAPPSQIAIEHVQALADEVGTPPLATFVAPHDIGVQDGSAPLAPVDVHTGAPLDLAMLPADAVRRLATAAHRATLEQLQGDVLALHQDWKRHDVGLRTLRDEVTLLAEELGQRSASTAFPTEPLIEAFRQVLDRRGGTHSVVRAPIGWLATQLATVRSALWRQLGWSPLSQATTRSPEESVLAHEQEALSTLAPQYLEGAARLAASFDPDRSERPAVDAAIQAALSEDARRLAPEALVAAMSELTADNTVISASFRSFCEDQVDAAIEARGGDAGIQWAATMLASVPVALVATEVALTHGFGTGDVAAGVVAALSAPVWKYLIEQLGRDLVVRVRNAWIEERGRKIGASAMASTWPTTWPLVQARLGAWASRGQRWPELVAALGEAVDDAGREAP